MIEKQFFESGRIQQVTYKQDGLYHNEEGPAIIAFYDDGKHTVNTETYMIQGECHNLKKDAPAEIWYHPNGKIRREVYYKNGKIHRDNLPADIWYTTEGEVQCSFNYINGEEQE